MKGEVQELNEKVQAKGFLLEDILNDCKRSQIR